MHTTMHYPGYDSYRPGNAWFVCDRCGQRFRRSAMCVEWDNLRVDKACLDPRPPQQYAPNIYPEGLPFIDARPPQDLPDRLTDDTTLQPVVGGIEATNGLIYTSPAGQDLGPGALSPQDFLETVQMIAEMGAGSGVVIGGGDNTVLGVTTTGTPQGPSVLEDDVAFITGRVFAKP